MQIPCSAQNEIDENATLPRLRPDLEILPGPAAIDGAPTYTIYDPVSRRFSKVGWAESTILEQLRSPATFASLKENLLITSTVRISDQELMTFVHQTEQSGLTTSTLTMPIEKLMAQSAAARPSLFNWFLKNYLYIRIPLLRPDTFLTASLSFAKLFISPLAICFYFVAGLWGGAGLIQNWKTYLNTFPYFFNFSGMFWYGISIVLLKAIHEFSHAFTAKNAGIRVPVMGIAFIVMWPVAFCDVTDGWRIQDRMQRLNIALAGISAELIIAGLALFGWTFSGPGIFNSICFVVSSTSLISTLVVNLNPAMSFDGYYILMDFWGVDNLRPRSMAVTRWFYRKCLFGLNLSCPERDLSTKRLCAFLIYSVYSWFYRLFLYVGIAVLMYYKFTKTLGLFLFAVEIWWFVLKPSGMEMKNLMQNKTGMRFTRPGMVLLLILFLLTGWAALPIKRSLNVPAVIVPRELQVVYSPTSGVLQLIQTRKGDIVSKGQILAKVSSQALDSSIKELQAELEILHIERDNLELSEKDRPFLPQKEDEISQAVAKLKSMEKAKQEQCVRARASGKVLWWNENMRPGYYISKDAVMGRIADADEYLIRAFVEEERIGSVLIGDIISFYPRSGADPVSGIIKRISPARSEHIDHVALTSLSQGLIPVAPDASGRMQMLDSYYAIEIEPSEKKSVLVGQSGTARLTVKPESLFLNWLRKGYRVFLRESGF